jgi:CheY-like chemotaxis protein
MPVMDGSTFLPGLESDFSIKDLPVVVLTVGAERPPYQIAGFMKKPLDIEVLIRVATQYAG